MKKKNKFKKMLPNVLLALFFLIGLLIFLYPYASDLINMFAQVSEINKYEATVSKLTTDDYDKLFNEAYQFNQNLVGHNLRQNKERLNELGYNNILAVSGNGMIGYLKIGKINVRLPIYHGTDATILQSGIGHFEGTSFPIGQDNEHSVLVGHTGLPSAKLLTDLAELKVGDNFEIIILNKILKYEVNQILIVEPNDTESLEIEEGKTFCTLITCTPYGVNSHRLLVRGELKVNEFSKEIISDAKIVNSNFVIIAISIPLLIILFIIMVVLRRRKLKKEEKNEELRKETK